jgi:hypothetical protein
MFRYNGYPGGSRLRDGAWLLLGATLLVGTVKYGPGLLDDGDPDTPSKTEQLKELAGKTIGTATQMYREATVPSAAAVAEDTRPPVSVTELTAIQQLLATKPDACPTGKDEAIYRMYVGDQANNVIACLALGQVKVMGDKLMVPLKSSDRPGYRPTDLSESVGATPDPARCADIVATITPYIQGVIENDSAVPDDKQVPFIVRMSASGISPCDTDYVAASPG